MKSLVLCIGVGLALALALAGQNAAAQTPDGQALYRQQCRACHGATGVAPQRMVTLYKNIPNLSDSTFLAARSEDSLVAVIRDGVGRDMKPFKDKLTPEEMAAVASYVRTLARPAAPPKPP